VTTNGKAIVSRNNLKHGLLSADPVIDSVEDRTAWDEHLQGILESKQPVGYEETLVATRIAVLQWRLFRPTRYETEMLSKSLENFANEPDPRGFVAARLIPGEQLGPKIMRYEAHLHREWLQTQHEYEAMQARRRGERTPLARLDITGAPAG
jgi:hypothetical protein